MCILFVYTLLNVSNYDLSFLSMSVMGFQKYNLDIKGVGGWFEHFPVLMTFFLTLQSPLISMNTNCF